jgi:hypothetical protein
MLGFLYLSRIKEREFRYRIEPRDGAWITQSDQGRNIAIWVAIRVQEKATRGSRVRVRRAKLCHRRERMTQVSSDLSSGIANDSGMRGRDQIPLKAVCSFIHNSFFMHRDDRVFGLKSLIATDDTVVPHSTRAESMTTGFEEPRRFQTH